MGIAVDVLLGPIVTAFGLESPDDQLVGLLSGHEAPLELGPGRAGEGAVRRDRPKQGESVLFAGAEVIGSERRRHMHDPGTVARGDEIACDDDAVFPVGRERDHIERTPIGLPDQGAPEFDRFGRGGIILRAEDRGGSRDSHEQAAAVADPVGAVFKIGVDRGGHVGRQGPRRGGPDQQFAPGAILEREGHIHRLVADLLVA